MVAGALLGYAAALAIHVSPHDSPVGAILLNMAVFGAVIIYVLQMASFLRLATAGCNYIMGIPGGDDTMLSYQSMSFHDALYVRRLLGLRPAPEFEEWLAREPEWEWRLIS